MNLSTLSKKFDQIGVNLQNYIDSIYTHEHDHDYNLHLKFGTKPVRKIPVVDLRSYQLEQQVNLLSGKAKRFCLEWPRRAGKEVFTWSMIIQSAILKPGMYLMVYPTNVRARKILWDGAPLINGESLRFLKMIPRELIKRINNQEMTIELINDSLIWVLGSNVDPEKLRGTNPLGMVLSEFAFADPRILYSMLPTFRQNNGWIIVQSTYNGMNHFYWLLKKNLNNPEWICREESIRTLVDANGNPYITDEDVESDRQAGMPEYLIQQEYYGNVTVNEETKYFSIAMNNVRETGRIVSGLFLPNKNAYAFLDIGVDDATSVTIAQFERRGTKMWPIVIGYLENNNRDLRFYVDETRKFCNRMNVPLHSFYLPHDGKNRNFNDGLKTSVDYLQEMGERGFVVKRPVSHRDAIELIRQKLYMTTFNEENTTRLIDCLCDYGKEYDDNLGKFKDSPIHNWSSHGVKSYQTMALALDADLINEICYDVIYMQ